MGLCVLINVKNIISRLLFLAKSKYCTVKIVCALLFARATFILFLISLLKYLLNIYPSHAMKESALDDQHIRRARVNIKQLVYEET